MRILIVLTYYRPHASGLTIYAERLAIALAQRGHKVTVLTSQYAKGLPQEELMDGVRVVRVPVVFRVSKGVIMPKFGITATRLVLENDVIQLHLPQFDAAGVAMRGRLWHKPTVITYHCDLRMPPGLFNRAANHAIHWMNEWAAKLADRIVTNTQDYAENSPFLKRYLDKVHIIPPPIILPSNDVNARDLFGHVHNPEQQYPVIGMASRFATEKGIELLLDALPELLAEYPQALVQFVGAYQNVVGEEEYFARLYPRIQAFEKSGNWKFLGLLTDSEMPSFYANLDLLILPSLNATESFGIVQIEAMMKGVPVVASDLPGVRQPTKIHQMGKTFQTGNAADLARTMMEVLLNRSHFIRDPEPIAEFYLPERIALAYEALFESISAKPQPEI